ncbi:hypothetical protein ABPG72_021985 [Tetrahymena utriculariae]
MCQIGRLGIQYTGKCKTKLEKLEKLYLDIGYNNLSPDDFIELAQKFKFAVKLNELSLRFQMNQVEYIGVKSLSEEISQLQNLTTIQIDIQENKIENQGLSDLGQQIYLFISNDNSLIKIKLISQNTIQDIGIQVLSKGIRELQKLKYLNLSLGGNSIEHGISFLFENVCGCFNLASFSLDLQQKIEQKLKKENADGEDWKIASNNAELNLKQLKQAPSQIAQRDTIFSGDYRYFAALFQLQTKTFVATAALNHIIC